jgi:hypothetical protein
MRYGVGWTADLPWPNRIVSCGFGAICSNEITPGGRSAVSEGNCHAVISIKGHSLEYFAILRSNQF